MSQNKEIRNIIKCLDELQASANKLNNNKIPAIDIDLALDKTRNLYDTLLGTSSSKSEKAQSEETTTSDNVEKEEIIQQSTKSQDEEVKVLDIEESKEEEKTADEQGDKKINEQEEKVTNEKVEEATDSSNAISPDNIDKVQVEEVAKTIEAPTVDSPDSEAEKPAPTLFDAPTDSIEKPTTIGEQFSGNDKNVNDNIASNKGEQDVATKLKLKPIDNIKSAIGINDRFLFVNELFDGNPDKYNNTLDQINSFTNINEAQEFITQNFSWDTEAVATSKFNELIERRFLATT